MISKKRMKRRKKRITTGIARLKVGEKKRSWTARCSLEDSDHSLSVLVTSITTLSD
jgi:hypothetical protein